MVEDGYTVFANADASDANDRMRAAGVQVMSKFAIAADLVRNWRNKPGVAEMTPFYDTYVFL